MTRSVQDRWIGSVLVLISLCGFTLVGDLPDEAAMFIRLVLVIIGLLALFLVVTDFLHIGRRLGLDDASAGVQRLQVKWKPVAATMVLITVYVALITLIGYFTTTFLFVVGFVYAFARQRLGILMLVSLGFTAALYLIFDNLFHVPMPPELLGF